MDYPSDFFNKINNNLQKIKESLENSFYTNKLPEGKLEAILTDIVPGMIDNRPILKPVWSLQVQNKSLKIYGDTFWLHTEGGIAWFLNFLNILGFDMTSITSFTEEILDEIIKTIKQEQFRCIIKIKYNDTAEYPKVTLIKRSKYENTEEMYQSENTEEMHQSENTEKIHQQEEVSEKESSQNEEEINFLSLSDFLTFCKKQNVNKTDITKMIGINFGDVRNTRNILSQYIFKKELLTKEEKTFLESLDLGAFIE